MTDMNELMAEHQKMLDEYNAARKAFQEKGKVILKDSFKAFFETNPKIKAITWTQFTPYFNDGEPCTFSVHDMWVLSQNSYDAWKEDDGYAEEYDVASTYVEEQWENELTKEEKEKVKTFVRSINTLPDDLFEDLFGDHAEVTATAEGFEVEEYSHD